MKATVFFGNLALNFFVGTVVEIITIIIIITYLFILNPILAIATTLGIFINSVIQNKIGKKTYIYSGKASKQNEKIENLVLEILNNVPSIKTNNIKKSVINRLNIEQNKMIELEVKQTVEISIIDELSVQILEFIKIAVYIISGYLVFKNVLSVGGVFAYVSFMGWLDNSFSIIWKNFSTYKGAKAKAELIDEIYTKYPTIISNVTLPANIDVLCVKNINYKYEKGNFAVNDVSFSAVKGNLTAIVGESGCGKSTLLKILSGLYICKNGKILLDNMDITNTTPENRGKCISYISQDSVLMDGTLRDVINVTGKMCSDEKIFDALKMVNLYEWMETLPQGINTVISTDNINISGGQRQRIAIAQAIIKDSSILLLDEVTSSLDEATQIAIISTLNRLAKDKIILMTIHRLNVIKYFEQIIFMENGKIVGSSEHDEMINSNEKYKKFFKY